MLCYSWIAPTFELRLTGGFLETVGEKRGGEGEILEKKNNAILDM